MCLVWHVIVAAYQLDPEPRHVNIHTFKISSLQGDLMKLIAAQESGRITYVEQLNSISCAKNERLEPLLVFLSLQWATPAAPHMFLVCKWFDNYIAVMETRFSLIGCVKCEKRHEHCHGQGWWKWMGSPSRSHLEKGTCSTYSATAAFRFPQPEPSWTSPKRLRNLDLPVCAIPNNLKHGSDRHVVNTCQHQTWYAIDTCHFLIRSLKLRRCQMREDGSVPTLATRSSTHVMGMGRELSEAEIACLILCRSFGICGDAFLNINTNSW